MSLIKSRQTGFTLIEMMVTIAIAALLGLMVVPNLVSMVDSGKTSVLVNKFPPRRGLGAQSGGDHAAAGHHHPWGKQHLYLEH